MIEHLPLIGKVWRARWRYAYTCRVIDGMKELPADKKECAKEIARQALMVTVSKYAANG